MLKMDNSSTLNKDDIAEGLSIEHRCRSYSLKPDNQPHCSGTRPENELSDSTCKMFSRKWGSSNPATNHQGDEKKKTYLPNLSEGILPPHVPCNGPFSIMSRSLLDPNINIELQDSLLWNKFARQHTEMIITKPGRRIFPAIRLKVSGMDPSATYCVIMDLVSVDDNRYKYQSGRWIVAGRGEPPVQGTYFIHPSSPARGSKWMQDFVSFQKVKLTNSCSNMAAGKFLIHSMHQYQPRFHVIRADDVSKLQGRDVSTFSFPETNFITVTAYQNNDITKLKVDNNPFARGFRNNGGKTLNAQIFSSEMHRAGQRYLQDQHRWRDDSYLLHHRQDVVSQKSNWANRTISLSAPSLSSQSLPLGFIDNPRFHPVTTHASSCMLDGKHNQVFPPYQQPQINQQRFDHSYQQTHNSTSLTTDFPSSSRALFPLPQDSQTVKEEVLSEPFFQHQTDQCTNQVQNRLPVLSRSLVQSTEASSSFQRQYDNTNQDFGTNNIVQDQGLTSHQGSVARLPVMGDGSILLPNQNFSNSRFPSTSVAYNRHVCQQNSPDPVIQGNATPGISRYSHDIRSPPQDSTPVQMAQNSSLSYHCTNYQHHTY